MITLCLPLILHSFAAPPKMRLGVGDEPALQAARARRLRPEEAPGPRAGGSYPPGRARAGRHSGGVQPRGRCRCRELIQRCAADSIGQVSETRNTMAGGPQRTRFALVSFVLLAAASQTVGNAGRNESMPRRRLQATPREVILPFPHPELCAPEKCFLRVPASAFPADMHESPEQSSMLAGRYTEVMQAVREQLGLSPTVKVTVQQFINYCRQVARSSTQTQASIDTFEDPNDDYGRPSCDDVHLHAHAATNGDPGVSDACLTWMYIFKVFLFYEEQLRWDSAHLEGVPPGWCAQSRTDASGNCAIQGRCWPECISAVRTAQPGLVPEWCGPWPECSEFDPPFGNSYASGDEGGYNVTAFNLALFFLCGCCATLGCLRVASAYKRRRGARYEKVPVMEGVELAVDFGDDDTEDLAGREKVVPTSG